jgi:hypothetical protein
MFDIPPVGWHVLEVVRQGRRKGSSDPNECDATEHQYRQADDPFSIKGAQGT